MRPASDSPESQVVWKARLKVNHRRSVYCLNRSDPQARFRDLPHRHAMQPNGIRPMRRSSGKDAEERHGAVTAWVYFEHTAIRAVKPREHDEAVAWGNPGQCARERRINFKPRVGSAFRPLVRCLRQFPNDGSDVPDDLNRSALHRSGNNAAALQKKRRDRQRRPYDG